MADEPSPTILIVDDIEASRYTLRRMLQKANYGVHEAATGQDALRLLAEKPDLVILDVNLPDISGHEVCRQIKADPVTASIPVLHLSASFVDADNRAEGLEGGADGYLTYPVEPRELLAHVESLLRARRAEQEVREQRELLQVTLNSIADAVIATDSQGRVTFLNPVAQKLTGWSLDACRGKPLADIFHTVHTSNGERTENPVELVLRGGAASRRKAVRLLARDSTATPIDESVAPIRDGLGRFLGVVLVFRDVTERLRAEELLRQADRRKDEFLATLAHELRNPLAPIRHGLQILNLISSQDDAATQTRAMMNRQLDQMVHLIDDLLDLSRITHDQIELRKERVELDAVVWSALEASKPLIEQARHQLTVELPSRPVILEVDPTRLAQVVLNLLNNAAKYTDPGGRIWLTVEADNQLVIRVRDNGIGISPQMLPRIFEMFTQVDRSLERSRGGLGIGLTLVRRLIEMHGGTVSAHSEGIGRGSEFVVKLPLPQLGPADLPRPTERKALPKRRILVVDDNEDAANSLAMLMKLWGNETQTAYDGPGALASASVFHPEVVLLDIGLPGLDGYQVARRMREVPTLRRVKLVALTGWGQEEDRSRGREAGFDHHLVKPVDLGELEKLLAAIS
jgi:PAS domain S-box-containing protein